MERRDFIFKSGLVAALGAVAPVAFATNSTVENFIDLLENLKPVLLQGQPPLHHNGSMVILLPKKQRGYFITCEIASF